MELNLPAFTVSTKNEVLKTLIDASNAERKKFIPIADTDFAKKQGHLRDAMFAQGFATALAYLSLDQFDQDLIEALSTLTKKNDGLFTHYAMMRGGASGEKATVAAKKHIESKYA